MRIECRCSECKKVFWIDIYVTGKPCLLCDGADTVNSVANGLLNCRKCKASFKVEKMQCPSCNRSKFVRDEPPPLLVPRGPSLRKQAYLKKHEFIAEKFPTISSIRWKQHRLGGIRVHVNRPKKLWYQFLDLDTLREGVSKERFLSYDPHLGKHDGWTDMKLTAAVALSPYSLICLFRLPAGGGGYCDLVRLERANPQSDNFITTSSLHRTLIPLRKLSLHSFTVSDEMDYAYIIEARKSRTRPLSAVVRFVRNGEKKHVDIPIVPTLHATLRFMPGSRELLVCGFTKKTDFEYVCNLQLVDIERKTCSKINFYDNIGTNPKDKDMVVAVAPGGRVFLRINNKILDYTVEYGVAVRSSPKQEVKARPRLLVASSKYLIHEHEKGGFVVRPLENIKSGLHVYKDSLRTSGIVKLLVVEDQLWAIKEPGQKTGKGEIVVFNLDNETVSMDKKGCSIM